MKHLTLCVALKLIYCLIHTSLKVTYGSCLLLPDLGLFVIVEVDAVSLGRDRELCFLDVLPAAVSVSLFRCDVDTFVVVLAPETERTSCWNNPTCYMHG